MTRARFRLRCWWLDARMSMARWLLASVRKDMGDAA